MEMRDLDLHQKNIEEADEWYNADMIAPAFSTIPVKVTEDGSLDKAWINETIKMAQEALKVSDPTELKELRDRVFNWMQLPDKDKWYD